MKIYNEYNRPCLKCKNLGDEENMCANCKHNYDFLYLAVNKTAVHIFENEEQFNNFIRVNLGKYKVILPKDYFEKKEHKNNYNKE